MLVQTKKSRKVDSDRIGKVFIQLATGANKNTGEFPAYQAHMMNGGRTVRAEITSP